MNKMTPMKLKGESTAKKLTDETIAKITGDCEAALKKGKLTEEDIADYLAKVKEVLTDYKDRLGEEANIFYRIRKRNNRTVLRMAMKGRRIDPFEEGSNLEKRAFQKVLSNYVRNPETSLMHLYTMGYNVVSIRSPKAGESKNPLKQPMVVAILLGLLLGSLCQLLPENVSGFIINDLASRLQKIIIAMVAGVMGPFAFLSILSAVSNLDSVSSLNAIGGKVLKRFFLIALSTSLVYILVGLLFFPVLNGSSEVSYDPNEIIKMLFGIIPTSLFQPFVDNNLPQMIIIGIVIGVVFLMLGEIVSGIKQFNSQLHEIVGELLSLVSKVMPAVPFLSIMILMANGEFSTLIMGWKYIVASLICIFLCLGIKIVKVTTKCKVSFPVLWRKMKPAVTAALATGSARLPLRKCYDISENQLGINSVFVSFFQPLSCGMLGPAYSTGYILAPFMVAHMTDTPVSLSFIIILLIIALQLSLASTGLVAALSIIFHCLGLPMEYVGLFAAYNVFLKNITAPSMVLYRLLEETEVAMVTDNIDMSYLKPEEAQTA